MTYSKGDGAYGNGTLNSVFLHHFKQKASEYHLFNKADIEHRENMKYNFTQRIVYIDTAPQIDRYNNKQRNKIKIFLWVFRLCQAVISSSFQHCRKEKQKERKYRVYNKTHGACITEILNALRIDCYIYSYKQNAK